MHPPEEDREKEETLKLELKDFVAICIAVYQLLFPRLLAVIAGVILVAWLLVWLWR